MWTLSVFLGSVWHLPVVYSIEDYLTALSIWLSCLCRCIHTMGHLKIRILYSCILFISEVLWFLKVGFVWFLGVWVLYRGEHLIHFTNIVYDCILLLTLNYLIALLSWSSLHLIKHHVLLSLFTTMVVLNWTIRQHVFYILIGWSQQGWSILRHEVLFYCHVIASL